MLRLTDTQRGQLAHFEEIARDLNRSVNLYSPASAADFERRHTLHALMLSTKAFPGGSRVVDWGTGGGVPGLPLAIAFPEVSFVLIDTIEKKIRAVRTMVRRLGLENVEAWSGRAETWDGSLTHSVSRATSSLSDLWSWHCRGTHPEIGAGAGDWKPGLICLKGGDLSQEIRSLHTSHAGLHMDTLPLHTLTTDPYFGSKAIVHVYAPSH